MAPRAAKAPLNDPRLEPGNNSGTLTEEEREALWLAHLDKIRGRQGDVDRAMNTVKEIRKTLNKVRNEAKADGFPLHVVDRILKDEGRSRGDLRLEAEQERWMRERAGLPVGGQGELFTATPAAVMDELDAEAEGYRAGIRGDGPEVPKKIDPSLHQAWLKGRQAGQERNAWALSESGKIVDRRTDVGVGGAQVVTGDEDDDEDEQRATDDAAGADDDDDAIPGENMPATEPVKQ